MTCHEMRDLMGPYVDDDLPIETRRRVEAHLLVCRDCAWESQTLHIARQHLRENLGEVVASDAFRARTLGRLLSDNPHVSEPEAPAVDPAQYRLPIRM